VSVKRLGDADIEAIRAKNPGARMKLVGTQHGDFVFRAPSAPEYRRFQDSIADKKASQAIEFLARACVVHPSREEFASLLEQYPGIPADCTEALVALAGTTGQAEVKDL
jgi:hypothetical protein